ncbi:rRNA maturation RNase YbeY [Spirulina sp. CS-785/01]|uniref:rRNA maturation RNase YbeY n=1 Tax=Spirulina sp. CS-785/01 TaxID=3021716 RepID=UPI00232EA1E1|nr:rRNA maturation RNase YbeY [Spirulina sp. CS-785/01]MDB9312171.1 rRNA maturation RNase YbeY [Spirulina sp. CS-785/01]
MPPLTLEFHLEDHYFPTLSPLPSPFPEELWEHCFHQWLEQLAPSLSANNAYELSLRLTDDRNMEMFNTQYRQKEQPTDVLAFAALESELYEGEQGTDEPLYLGDIIISVETANRQAKQQSHSLKTELAWLASHGMLHLLGWDHPDEPSLQRMLQEQERLLRFTGFVVKKL